MGLGIDQVVVIEDEDHPAGEGGYLVDQRRSGWPRSAAAEGFEVRSTRLFRR